MKATLVYISYESHCDDFDLSDLHAACNVLAIDRDSYGLDIKIAVQDLGKSIARDVKREELTQITLIILKNRVIGVKKGPNNLFV